MVSEASQEKPPFSDITYAVIGCAMRVHNALGPGLKESVYQQALSLELEKSELSFEEEFRSEIFIDDVSIGLLFLDHVVEGQVVVEEKAFSHLLTNEEVAQVITYLCATGLRVGLLLNFGRNQLEYKRILPPRNVARWRERINRYVWRPNERRAQAGVRPPRTRGEGIR
jgi:GxxExxY protein